MSQQLPLLIEPEVLSACLKQQTENLLLVDLCKETTFREQHIPSSVHLAYAALTVSDHPIHGLLPDPEQLQQLFSDNGIGNDTHVIAYDDEGGGNAARLLWTLHAMGHEHYSLLNGGLHAWANEGNPCSRELFNTSASSYQATPNHQVVATTDYILERLESPDLALWDARSRNEFSGISRFSQYLGFERCRGYPGSWSDWGNRDDTPKVTT